MRVQALYYSFLGIFVLTAIVTLLGVLGVVPIKDTHLNLLLGAFILELAVAVISLFKRTDFFTQEDTSLMTSLSFAVDSFDRLSDEIEAAITNNPQPVGAHAHRFIIRRFGNGVVAYQKMQEFSEEHFAQLPPEVRRQIRTYRRSMKALEKDWEAIKRNQATSPIDPQVREKQLALIKAMKGDLIGIVDVLERAGFYLDDHYLNVRSLVSQL
jgi:hypothetical protein